MHSYNKLNVTETNSEKKIRYWNVIGLVIVFIAKFKRNLVFIRPNLIK